MVEIDNILDVEQFLDGIDAVIFDLDDTLYSEKEYVRSGYREIAKLISEVTEEELWKAFLNKEPAIDVVLERHGLMNRKEEALHAYRHQQPYIHLYNGVNEMLERLDKVGIITDGRPEGQRAKLEALGLDYKVIITDELGGIEFRKPNEAAFRLMQEKMHVPFEKMAYVGDNIKKDFIAPEKLGMKCIYFKNPDGLYIGVN